MRKWAIILAVLAIIGVSFGTVHASSPGPAPNSGDGIPDGPSDGDWPLPPGPSGPSGPNGK